MASQPIPPRTSHRAKTVGNGTKILEIVVAVMILGVLASIAAPRLFSTSPF